jgi:hypothetical protein
MSLSIVAVTFSHYLFDGSDLSVMLRLEIGSTSLYFGLSFIVLRAASKTPLEVIIVRSATEESKQAAIRGSKREVQALRGLT